MRPPPAERRYAVYWAPPAGSDLSCALNDLIGYDNHSGKLLPIVPPEGYSPDEWVELTREPRTYGIHATLKAPFRLRDGVTLAELHEALGVLSSQFSPIHLGQLQLSAKPLQSGGSFMALTAGESAHLSQLEKEIVTGLDRFRAPLTDREIARRQPHKLSGRQSAYLARYGYPFVHEDFRFHVTLTGETDAPDRTLAAIRGYFFNTLPAGLDATINTLSLFEQTNGKAHFVKIKDFELRDRHL